MRCGVVAGVVLALTASGCGLFSRHPKPVEPEAGAMQTGIASWYGPGFHGRRTSSGEVYDQYAMTAAHQTLPHGTRVRVTNLANGREIVVRINDRGPFVDDRIIDLSYAGAQRLDMVGPGTAPVRLEVLGPGAIEPAPPPSILVPARAVAAPPAAAVPMARAEPVEPPARYAVQVGAFADYERARRMQRALAAQGASVRLGLVDEGGVRYYRLRLGPFPGAEAASRAARQVAALGYPALVVAEGSSGL